MICDKKVLFLGKKDDSHCQLAVEFALDNFADVDVFLGGWGDPFPAELSSWNGDIIVSYLSRWVVPESLLQKVNMAAINFHPASPDYPGIGCNNFALYEEAAEYGATCHHMAGRVDTGNIILVKRFPIFPEDSVATLLARTYEHLLNLYYEIMGRLSAGQPLPQSDERWTREPFTREQFNELGVIKPDMSLEEIRKRVRATSYGIYQPIIKIGDFEFVFKGGMEAK